MLRGVLAVLMLVVISSQGLVVAASSEATNRRADSFAAAAREFKVPESVLLAIAYNESRWTPHGDEPSNNNGYGLMNLRSKYFTDTHEGHGKGDRNKHHLPSTLEASRYTLEDASRILGVSSAQLKTDDHQNIRGGAAVLAKYARETNGGKLPSKKADWHKAVAAYSGSLSEDQAKRYADSVYTTLYQGAARETKDGQFLTLAADPTLEPTTTATTSLDSTVTDCPTTIQCRFIPAAYTQNSTDPTDYGNYDTANRPTDMPIKSIIIHDTEGSYDGTISWFQNPKSYVSAHYVIRSSDGAVTEMVRPDDVSWTAGNWHTNMHSINIEHEGFATEGATWYTDAMYQSSAKLVQYLAAKYNIPLDRQHIIGHDQVPTLDGSRMSGQHWDPGPYWDWNRYMELVQGTKPTGPAVAGTSKVLTILPDFETNKPTITKCNRRKGCNLPSQGASIVFLRTQPSIKAPLLTDKYKHPDGTAGTTLISDWSATATSGRQYAVAGTSGTWTAIWFGSQKGWFENPTGSGQKAVESNSLVITPRVGLTSLNVYGGAYPEASAFPVTIPVKTLSPLYTIPAGQSYPIMDNATTDYYYAPTIDSSKPDDHTVVIGQEAYYQISYNHRVVYVKAADVTVTQQ